MFIFQIDLTKLVGGENSKGISQTAENPESVLLRSLSSANKPRFCDNCHPHNPPASGPFPPDGQVPPNDQIPSGMLFGKVMDLSNEYIIYAQTHKNDFNTNDTPNRHQLIMKAPPWGNSNELFDALSQYTGIPESQQRIGAVKEFFNKIMRGMSDDVNQDGTLDCNDVLAIWNNTSNNHDALQTVKKLSKELLDDPYNNLIEVPKLGKALAKLTHTEYDLGKADSLFNFFLRDKSDLTGDGKIDYKDVIKFWKSLDHSNPPVPIRPVPLRENQIRRL